MRKRLRAFVSAGLLLAFALPVCVAAQSISVTVDAGHYTSDTILTETPIIFMLRYTNPDPVHAWSISNGYRIYSPDGAVWRGPSLIDTMPGVIPASSFDLAYATVLYHGATADTFGVLGAFLHGPGLLPMFDGFPYAIRIGGFEISSTGLHVCLDSTWFRPGGAWKWANGSTTVYPAWGGPYCYTIYDLPCGKPSPVDPSPAHCGCCLWTTGNVDGDPADLTDISDVVAMVDYLRSSQPLSGCPGENDVDLSGQVDISDLMMLIDNLVYGALLPPCPFGS